MINDKLEASQQEKIAAAKIKLKEFKNRNIPSIQSTLDKISDIDQENPISFDSFKKLNIPSLIETNLGSNEIRDQLKLHIQTIGLLVAEKTELQSKLNQQIKKCDKQQDECNELTGRLKASRQKISELEKIVQKLESDKLTEENNKKTKSDSELRQNLDIKNQENFELIQLVSKLKNQIELLNDHKKTNDNDEYENLLSENSKLRTQFFEVQQQREVLKTEYKSYVEGLQKQIENLVDQINKLVDEREKLFIKIDSLQEEIKKFKDNKTNSKPFDNAKDKTEPKIELLEKEIKYFKQQIEILLKEKNNLHILVEGKTKEIDHLNNCSKKIEAEKQNLDKLIEESYNNKQLISRILKQNNELKIDLETIQEENLKMKNEISKFKLKIDKFVQTDQLIDSTTIYKEKLPSKREHNNENFSGDLNLDYNESKQFNKIVSEKNSGINSDFKSCFISQPLNFEGETLSIEKMLDYMQNMKLIEKKFILVMEENVKLKEKNNELEHIIKQLEFETDTIIDYITMYQIERGKLNEKYKIKEDTIKNMSSVFNIFYFAFLELDNLVSTLINLEDEKKKLINENNDETNQRFHFILITIKNIMFELTNFFLQNSKLYFSKEINWKISKVDSNKKNETLEIEKNVAKFKSETIICSNCYGDLFIV